jgi:hypothetical protein
MRETTALPLSTATAAPGVLVDVSSLGDTFDNRWINAANLCLCSDRRKYRNGN